MFQKAPQVIEAFQGCKQRRLVAGLFPQPQHRAGHDAKAALGADEQLLEIVACVVLDHLVHGRHDGAVGQHRFQTQHHVARHTVADDPVAAGVGRDVAAHGAATPGSQIEGIQQSFGVGSFLQVLQQYSGLHHGGSVDRVYGLNAIHAFHGQHQFVRRRQSALYQPRQPAMGHHRLARGMAGLKNQRDLLGAARTHDGPGRDGVLAPDSRRAFVHVIAGEHSIGAKLLA